MKAKLWSHGLILAPEKIYLQLFVSEGFPALGSPETFRNAVQYKGCPDSIQLRNIKSRGTDGWIFSGQPSYVFVHIWMARILKNQWLSY